MIIIGKLELQGLKERYPEVSSQVDTLIAEVTAATWKTPHELRKHYGSASILPGRNVVINLKGTKYRVWLQISFQNQVAVIKKAGTHQEYVKWSIA